MGKRGPQPKPDELKRLEGNPGKRKINKASPVASGQPEPPAHLGKYAAKVWDQIAGSMPSKLYSACDTSLLVAYCEAADLHRRAVLAVRRKGVISTGQNGAPYQNPWVSIQNKQAQLLATLGSRLGLDPAARASLQMPEEDKPKSKFGALIGIKGGRSE